MASFPPPAAATKPSIRSLTDDEMAQVAAVRAALEGSAAADGLTPWTLAGSPELTHGYIFRFFVGAGGHSATAAAESIGRDLEWRAKHGVAALTPAAFPHFSPQLWYHAGRTAGGNVVLVATAKHFLPGDIPNRRECVDYVAWHMEKTAAMMDDTELGKFSVLVDLRGFGLSNISVGYVPPPTPCAAATVRLLSARHSRARASPSLSRYVPALVFTLLRHYPERLGTAYMIGAPFVFGAFWSVINGLLDERTRSKVSFLPRAEPEGIAAALDGIIDPAALEEKFGGTHAPYPPAFTKQAVDGEEA